LPPSDSHLRCALGLQPAKYGPDVNGTKQIRLTENRITVELVIEVRSTEVDMNDVVQCDT